MNQELPCEGLMRSKDAARFLCVSEWLAKRSIEDKAMGYLSFLLSIVVLFLGFIGWTLDRIRDSLKSIDSKLDSVDDHAHNLAAW